VFTKIVIEDLRDVFEGVSSQMIRKKHDPCIRAKLWVMRCGRRVISP
jgi:hypothetical protein